MSDVDIRAENLGKKYRIRHQQQAQGYVALRDVIARRFTAPIRWVRDRSQMSGNGSQSPSLLPPISTRASREDFWALKSVFFEVKRGQVVGIIGRNGAGKSTLLKILSRITEPTEGRVRLNGRVSSLLEVGTGFHPELTGRENIFLNGAILGMTRAEIKKKFDEIVAFAEIEKFLDTPVKRYSSGMYVRLAFAVAAHLEPEILIVDEVLAVGDAEFQKKCLGKMQDVSRGGRTVLFVSHNMGVVNTLTQRCIYLENGQIAAVGNSRDIIEMYLTKSINIRGERANELEFFRRNRRNDTPVRITGLLVNGHGPDSTGLPTVEMGAAFTIEIKLNVVKALQGAMLDMMLKRSHGERVTVLFSGDQGCALFLDPGRHSVTVRVGNLPLAPGNYFVDVGVNQSEQTIAYDVILDFPLFSIVNNGQVTRWLDRPWGVLHSATVEWDTSR